MKFVDITPKNIMLATKMELELFPDMCAYNSYINAYKNKKPYWIVYKNNTPVGLSGLYTYDELGEPDTVWMGWYGVDKNFRGQGIGKQILLETINRAKKAGFKTLRVYTSKNRCPEAMCLYQKYMDFGEPYTLEQQHLERYVFTKSLIDTPATKWNNRNLFLYLDKQCEKEAMVKYLNELNKNKEIEKTN